MYEYNAYDGMRRNQKTVTLYVRSRHTTSPSPVRNERRRNGRTESGNIYTRKDDCRVIIITSTARFSRYITYLILFLLDNACKWWKSYTYSSLSSWKKDMFRPTMTAATVVCNVRAPGTDAIRFRSLFSRSKRTPTKYEIRKVNTS